MNDKSKSNGQSAMKKTKLPTRTVGPVHFEDFDGKSFERLVYAYHARSDRWISLEWFGQGGKDHGRDIVGVRMVDGEPVGETKYVLCANWQKMTLAKIKKDINRSSNSPSGVPQSVRVICGHDVTASIRDEAKKFAQSKGIHDCEVWSGSELEEHVRATAESLLQRFCDGEVFPDAERELMLYSWGAVPVDDKERLELITRALDRPAFETPIWQESSLPAFRTAIEDTIRVLRTGIWQTREGNLIQRIPSITDVVSPDAQRQLKMFSKLLVALRTTFDEGVRAGAIEHCACGDPNCPTYMIKDEIREKLTDLRASALEQFKLARECCGLAGEWTND